MTDEPLLVLAPFGRDAPVICRLLAHAGVRAEAVDSLQALCGRLGDSAAVVMTDEALAGEPPGALAGEPPGALLDWVSRQPPWSDLPFIVLVNKRSASRGGRLAATLDGLGNVVLLERPLNADTLASAAHSALRARRRQLAMRDLTDTLESRVEQRTRALTESEAWFRAVFEGFPECVFVIRATPDGLRYEDLNPVGERYADASRQRVVGEPLGAMVDAGSAAELGEALRRCLDTRATVNVTQEWRHRAGAGTFDVTLTPMPDGDGRTDRVLGIARDVTERNMLEARLRQAQKLEAIGQLTGGVAHDFNNLLQVVLSGLTLLERVQEPERRRRLTESVRRAAQRGGDLTKRLLTVARRQALRPEPVDLGAWLQDGAGELLTRALRGDIEIVFDVPAGLPAVEVDLAELELALLNLAVNARDAMERGGAVTISAAAVTLDGADGVDDLSGAFVRLSVTDTGTGMDAETLGRVFEPFFTTKEVGKGTGLGLAQVYGFARQSGGGVKLRSAPGQGTTVSLLLPVSVRAAAALDTAPASAPEHPSSGAAVLVVEDDEDVAALVVDMLEQLGHCPARVTTGMAALGALSNERRVDVLFTDVLMPGGMDGLALAREAARRRPGLRILLTTGYTGGGAAAVPLGMPLLRKPYRLDELSRALEGVLAPERVIG